MPTEIIRILQEEADATYRDFSAKLLPPETLVLGVRIPALRRLAKQMLRDRSAEQYLSVSPALLQYHEEKLLYAMLLAGIKKPVDSKIQAIKDFIPYIKNWAVCDIFCADLKEVKKNPKKYFDGLKVCAGSGKEYQIRFFYVLALTYYICPPYLSEILQKLARQKYAGFYDKMAAAWFLSVAYVKYPQLTEDFLFTKTNDLFVMRKSISKICDSYRVSKEDKQRLRTKLKAYLQKGI